MNEINELRDRGTLLSLDELVAKANELLPRVLPEAEKLRQSELNPRLVRHFATLGLLDEAGRAGREARYGARHLLQLLVVRRLMAEGSTTSGVKKLTEGASDAELEGLLLSGVRRANLEPERAPQREMQQELQVEPVRQPEPAPAGNEALEWLQKIRSRSGPQTPSPLSSPPQATSPTVSRSAPPAGTPATESWRRIGVEDGLELHIREGFRAPNTPYEREQLLRRIEEELKNWLKKPKGKSR